MKETAQLKNVFWELFVISKIWNIVDWLISILLRKAK